MLLSHYAKWWSIRIHLNLEFYWLIDTRNGILKVGLLIGTNYPKTTKPRKIIPDEYEVTLDRASQAECALPLAKFWWKSPSFKQHLNPFMVSPFLCNLEWRNGLLRSK